jgi:hypothetical protein
MLAVMGWGCQVMTCLGVGRAAYYSRLFSCRTISLPLSNLGLEK